MKNKFTLFLLWSLLSFSFMSCEKDRSLNIFSVAQDIEFGETLKTEIESNPSEYPILSKSQYPAAYAYMENMMDEILESDKFKFADKFNWEITIINKNVMNAFAAPGGKLFFYTGLMKYLEDGASLAGVLGHEMAHADLRHSTSQMTKTYSLTTLLSILAGEDQSALAKIAAEMVTGLGSLKFSRDNEYDADRYSMYYLATTTSNYYPKGISSFFVKMMAGNSESNPFPWLSTHPSDQDRVDNVDDIWDNDSDFKKLRNGKSESDYNKRASEYQEFLKLLP